MALVYDILTDCYVDDVTGQRVTSLEIANMGQSKGDAYQMALQQMQNQAQGNMGLMQHNAWNHIGQYLGIGVGTTSALGVNPYAQQQYPSTVNGVPYHPPKKDEPETLRGWIDRRVREIMWVPA